MIEITILAAGTLLLLALSFAGATLVAYLTYTFQGRVFQALILAVASVSVLRILLSGRVLRLGDSGLEMLQEGDMGSTLIGKAMLLVLVGSAFSICIAWWLWRFGNKGPRNRYSAAGIAEINKLTWSFLLYYVAFSLLPLAFAPHFDFHVSLVYPLFVWLALLLALRTSAVDPVLAVRQALGLIVLSSLAAAVALPALALQPGYQSLIPGFSMRLWGMAASANTLGSVAGTLLIMQFIVKPRSTLRHHMLTACALTALVLTQSKSAIGGALVGLAILFAWRIWYGTSTKRISVARAMAGAAILFLLGAFVLFAVWLAVSEPTLLSSMQRSLDPRAVGGLSTMTGRYAIWDYAIQRGMVSPIFGHGLSMWDLQTRLATGLSGAVHAHNQFLQAFSRAGLVGLAAMLLLLVFIVRNALRSASQTSGGSLALLVIFLVRAISEVPLQPNGILGGEFFSFVAFLVYTTDRALHAPRAVPPDVEGAVPQPYWSNRLPLNDARRLAR